MRIRLSSIALLGLSALALTGCPEGSGTAGSGGAGGETSPGGAGTGGETTSSTTTTTTTTSSTMTAPLTCADPVTKPAIQNGECDLLQQSCPPGETCHPTDDGQSTFCRKEGGLKGAGKPCWQGAGVQECQSGLYCVGGSDVDPGYCTRPCCPADDQPCSGGRCNVEVQFLGNLIVLMCSYPEQCAMFEPGVCENGQKCQFLETFGVCTIPADKALAEGEPCEFINECPEFAVCSGNVCRYNCKIDSSAAPGLGGCPADQSCKAVYPNAPEYGVCSP